jgi:hypothetical protein
VRVAFDWLRDEILRQLGLSRYVPGPGGPGNPAVAAESIDLDNAEFARARHHDLPAAWSLWVRLPDARSCV